MPSRGPRRRKGGIHGEDGKKAPQSFRDQGGLRGLWLRAIAVVKGIAAQVDGERCVGCGKCARECPGTVIEIREVPA